MKHKNMALMAVMALTASVLVFVETAEAATQYHWKYKCRNGTSGEGGPSAACPDFFRLCGSIGSVLDESTCRRDGVAADGTDGPHGDRVRKPLDVEISTFSSVDGSSKLKCSCEKNEGDL